MSGDSCSHDSCAGRWRHGGLVHLDRGHIGPAKRRGWRNQLGEADLRKQRSHVPIRWETSTEHRREVDLYILTDNLDDLYGRFKDRVQIVEDPHDFYRMREFIIRDFNGFWITFGQPIQTQPVTRWLVCATRRRKSKAPGTKAPPR